nr:LicD family protein [Lachnospiraceae bacterium]
TNDKDFLFNNSGFPYPAGIDIMVIDYISEVIDQYIKDIVIPVDKFADAISQELSYNDMPEHQDFIDTLERTSKYHFKKDKPLAQQLRQFNDSYIKNVDKSEAKYATAMSAHITRDNFGAISPKAYYNELITLPFEFLELPVPLHYDIMLKRIFGIYMKPYRAGGTHLYPNYAADEEVCMTELGRKLIESYSYNKNDTADYYVRKEAVDKANENKTRDVVFLVTKASNWSYIKRQYEIAQSDPENNVFVIPIPYYIKNNLLKPDGKVRYEGAELSKLVEITGFDKYDFYGRHPDIVYFDTPYDDFDTYMYVHPMFHSDKLKLFSKKLIYISCIVVDEYDADDEKAKLMMSHCINTPGVSRADKVMVQSENIRQRYIDSLTAWAGDDTENIWKEKIVSGGPNADDVIKYPPVTDEELSGEWIEALKGADGSRRKVLLFHVALSSLIESKKNAVDKLTAVFDLFDQNRDTVVMYYNPDANIERHLPQIDNRLYMEYRRIVDEFIAKDQGIYDDGTDDNFMVRLCDGYYGDNSTVMYHCMRAHKPVMVMNYEI